MEPTGEFPPDPRGEPPGIKALMTRLVHDGQDFARAEVDFLKAQAGERASYALPGLVMIIVAVVLGFALIVALVVTAMVWLAAETGPALAMLIVTLAVLAIVAVLGWLGTARLKGALKAREQR